MVGSRLGAGEPVNIKGAACLGDFRTSIADF
jgi:hypothetical protein